MRDPLTRKTPSYTEYELYFNENIIYKRQAGNVFKKVDQFKKWCLDSPKCKELEITEIEILKPEIHHLEFICQRY